MGKALAHHLPMADWNPAQYARFGGLRLRPALDLIAQVPDLPPGDVIDLGCGSGAVAPALKARFAGRGLVGVDTSPAKLGEARSTGLYTALTRAEAQEWRPDTAPALIYSNALCHWLPDHAALFPRLAALLAPGGVLAVQMPRQQLAPSHRLLREVAARLAGDPLAEDGFVTPVSEPGFYVRLLDRFGSCAVWETEYQQRLAPVERGHPVRHFTQSTAMRPFVEGLPQNAESAFVAAYDEALAGAYPLESDGSVLFPFRRLFFVLTT